MRLQIKIPQTRKNQQMPRHLINTSTRSLEPYLITASFFLTYFGCHFCLPLTCNHHIGLLQGMHFLEKTISLILGLLKTTNVGETERTRKREEEWGRK